MIRPVLSLGEGTRRMLVVLAALLVGLATAFGVGIRTAETQTPPPTPTTKYMVRDLGVDSIANPLLNGPWGINDSGEVVGVAQFASQTRGFLYSNGNITNLDALPGFGDFSAARDINNSGAIVGWSSANGGNNQHAFLYDGTLHDLGTLEGDSASSKSAAYGINNLGAIVGESNIDLASGGGTRAFLKQPDQGMVSLGSLSCGATSGTVSVAYGINNNPGARIVGYSTIGSGSIPLRAFLYDGTMNDLGTLAPNSDCGDANQSNQAFGINDSDTAVGQATTANTTNAPRHAFLKRLNQGMVDLGVLEGTNDESLAYAINNSEEVVGYSGSTGTSDTRYAFLYKNGAMNDLNKLCSAVAKGCGPTADHSTWTLQQARAINNPGQIAAIGRIMNDSNNFVIRSVLLTPTFVSSVSPADEATTGVLSTKPTATFDREMNSSTITTSTFTLTKQGDTTPIEADVTYDSSSKQATLTPKNPALLDPGTTYTATIKGGSSGVKDSTGNTVGADTSWSFATEELPTVSSVSPPDQATGVPRSNTITKSTANFNKPMDPNSLRDPKRKTSKTFILTTLDRRGRTTQVSAKVACNDDTNCTTATLTPSKSLAANTTYTATVKGGSSGVKDTSGNTLAGGNTPAGDFSWTFTTTS